MGGLQWTAGGNLVHNQLELEKHSRQLVSMSNITTLGASLEEARQDLLPRSEGSRSLVTHSTAATAAFVMGELNLTDTRKRNAIIADVAFSDATDAEA